MALKAEFTMILTVICAGFGVKHRPSCQILMRLDFTRQTFQIKKSSNFMKIRPMVDKMFTAGGQPERRKNRLQIYRRPAKIQVFFTDSGSDIRLLSVRSIV